MRNKAQTETPSPPRGFEFVTESDRAALVGDLMFAAQGAALLLLAGHSHVQGDDWENVATGVSVVLATLANEVDARYFEDLGISLQSDAVEPRHRLYLLEQQAAELRKKIAQAKKEGTRS